MISVSLLIQIGVAQDQSPNAIEDITGVFSIEKFIELWGNSSCSACAQELLDAHNEYRREVGSPDLIWSYELESGAQKWADYLASNGLFEHSIGKEYGENIWWGWGNTYTSTQMVGYWGAEKAKFKNGPFSDTMNEVGHYTQIIWKDTDEVGCAVSQDENNGAYYLVCRYYPPGNVYGEYPIY